MTDPNEMLGLEPDLDNDDFEDDAPPELEDAVDEDMLAGKPKLAVSEPAVLICGAGGAVLSIASLLMVASDEKTTQGKALAAATLPLVISAAVGILVRAKVVPADVLDEWGL